MRTNAHIVIDQTLLPGHNPIDLELDFLDSKDLHLESHEHEPRAYASLEWIIPSFIAVYITKAYFEGFLNEMGADHYKQLKKWVQKQNIRFKKQITYKVTATNATKKIQSSDSTSNYFAIYLMTPLGNYIKVFMPRCLTDEEDIEAISSLLDNFVMLYSEPQSDYSRKIQLLNDKVYENLYAVYNTKMSEWEILTISTLVAKSQLNNAKEKKMIENDNLKNYIIIRHKLFRINNGIPEIGQPIQLVPWKKNLLEQDFGKGAISKVKIVVDPFTLSSEIKDLYLKFLEGKVFKWQKLI